MNLSQKDLHRPAPGFRREAITHVAAKLFYDHGFNNTSLTDIANCIGFRKPVIYESFVDKKDLLNGVASTGIEAGLLKLGTEPKSDLNSDELIDRLILVQEVFIFFHKHIVVYIREELNLRSEDASRIRAKRRKFDETLLQWIENLNEQKHTNVCNPEYAALSISGMITWPVFWYENQKSRYSIVDINDLSRDYLSRILNL